MKQTAQTLKGSQIIILALLVLVLAAMAAIAFQQTNPGRSKLSPQDQALESYGPLGYGRGRGGEPGHMATGQANQALNKDNCLMDGCLLADDADYPVATLDEKTIEYLILALADERKALATYQAAMARFGSIKPFVNIARAEEQHISMLLALFDKYGVTIPEDSTKVGTLPTTLQEVCQLGVTAEIENDALYQKMIPEIQQEDIVTVFTSLARASKEMHLSAFERCAT